MVSDATGFWHVDIVVQVLHLWACVEPGLLNVSFSVAML